MEVPLIVGGFMLAAIGLFVILICVFDRYVETAWIVLWIPLAVVCLAFGIWGCTALSLQDTIVETGVIQKIVCERMYYPEGTNDSYITTYQNLETEQWGNINITGRLGVLLPDGIKIQASGYAPWSCGLEMDSARRPPTLTVIK